MWKYILFLIAIHTIGRLPLGMGYAAAEVVGRLAYLSLIHISEPTRPY